MRTSRACRSSAARASCSTAKTASSRPAGVGFHSTPARARSARSQPCIPPISCVSRCRSGLPGGIFWPSRRRWRTSGLSTISDGRRSMAKTIEHVHWPDAPDIWMPYAPAIKVKGGTTVYLAGVTAAPVYHHHPHRPEEFDSMPRTMEGQARAALENLRRGLEAVGATFADVVTADRFVTDLSDQDALNRVWGEYFREAKPATTTVQVVRLATDPRCLVEINAVAVID